MNTLKTMIHSHYFWITIACLYSVILFIILPDEMSVKNQFFRYIGSLGAIYWTRAFILNKEIGFGVGHINPGEYVILRLFWFLICFYALIAQPLHLLGISVF